MRRSLVVVVLQCSLWGGTAFAQSLDREELEATYMKLAEARNSGDAEAIAEAVDDRAIFFDPASIDDLEERGKPAFLESLRGFFATTERFTGKALNPRYRVIGDTGIVWADIDVAIQYKDGGQVNAQMRAIHIFAKSDRGWRVVANFHHTRK